MICQWQLNVTEKQLNQDFTNICDWFVNTKLSVHFGEDETKSILFTSNRKIKKLQKLEIIYNNIWIKQHSRITYLGWNNVWGIKVRKVISKVIARLKFLHRNNKYLRSDLRHLLCNALIQPHFDYTCSAWYTNLSKKLKNKIQTSQKNAFVSVYN